MKIETERNLEITRRKLAGESVKDLTSEFKLTLSNLYRIVEDTKNKYAKLLEAENLISQNTSKDRELDDTKATIQEEKTTGLPIFNVLEEYKTTDLYLATALRAKGYKMTINTIRSHKFEFIFNGVNINDDVLKYWNNELMVNARSYAEAIKEMKVRIHN
jgi:hypothetical protein